MIESQTQASGNGSYFGYTSDQRQALLDELKREPFVLMGDRLVGIMSLQFNLAQTIHPLASYNLIEQLMEVMVADNPKSVGYLAFAIADVMATKHGVRVPATDSRQFKIVRAYDSGAKDIPDVCGKANVTAPAVYSVLDAYRPGWRERFSVGQ